MSRHDLADTVDVHVTVAPTNPEDGAAELLRSFERAILRMYGPERFDEAMRVFHASRAETEAELRGRQ